MNAQLARSSDQSGGAAAGEQRDGDTDFLCELRCQTVADVELLDLPRFAGVDDLAVGPDSVDVGDDQADVARAGRHWSGMLTGGE